ncbi:putative jacalin-like lectin domain-containing protein [Helianthus annuus]|uniref:Jacalin-like lectin domain-containing protein n=1 Tax=Helianthus annuus TaxID=4232 RepID=A0A251TWB6_HELAN|nr:mannose/glucose-specific lectin [Helianthus annuus]KAF5768010.1 putative jacalin-like lectin domain-containing protein [Helianthus annuus]KAJ0484826.1 putative jacalin-like lectin domain-containing protein [Helianthus annuus]KAJ0655377.1 putative jacalin-like lectin domain-containing protein [Helianthus annuus]KAJ0839336.1 putative jacalin-like lectin domain-containing protein [Helianthus annuus]KAJ0852668.1 putative jacalin-like lectin domain-containing protein [Helianthus annuus]
MAEKLASMQGVVQNMNIPQTETHRKGAGFIPVGRWGKQSGGPQNEWSFQLEQGQKLKKISIDHGDDVIYSLMFTTESAGGVLNTSNKFGGWNGGQTVSEVTFDSDEEIVGIKGSIGTKAQYTIISSLSFVTNKTTHGPFGGATSSEFSLPWENGSLVGFYGLAGYYIDGIGVYLRQLLKIGTWGKTLPAGPQNNWSFKLEPTYHLTKITIDHGDLIYSLMFTAQHGELTYTSEKMGGLNGGEKVSEITFDGDEEINGISGTIALSRGTYAGHTVISSISFMTNKKTHGPFGDVRGAPFTVPWDDGSFAGFYGLAGYYIDSIGVYLKATNREAGSGY